MGLPRDFEGAAVCDVPEPQRLRLNFAGADGRTQGGTISSTTNPSRERIDITPIEASMDRLQRITVCTRPFRAAGPRLDAERLGTKLLVHNYGHGGSGWSLSWGSASLIVPTVLAESVREVAVIGCGALGITSAISLQRAGMKVKIYARDLPADTRSARATGTWTPDARVALQGHIDEPFATRWERMARFSFAQYGELMERTGGLLGFHERYTLSELPPRQNIAQRLREDAIGFAHLESRIADMVPAPEDLGPGEHPFPAAYARRASVLRFNIAPYFQHLQNEFRERGGVLQRAEFHSPEDLLTLPEAAIVHCTGYGARALFGDESLIPVRGQIAWLPPQPELPYSLVWRDLNVVPRADGTVIQLGAQGDALGWQDGSETPDEAEAERGMRMAAELFAGMRNGNRLGP